MAKKYTFTDTEKKDVEQAVKDLETVSCGEIVPYFVNRSDDYAEASWYASSMLTAFIALVVGLLSYSWMLPLRLTPFEVILVILAAMVVGFLIPKLFPATRRLLISSEQMELRVRQRAYEAFLTEGMFNTEERVGILIFISRLEHKVLVIGDEGINKKVEPDDWSHIVETVVAGIKEGKIGNGLVKAIAQCKDLLLEHGFKRKSTDTNELDDSLRIED